MDESMSTGKQHQVKIGWIPGTIMAMGLLFLLYGVSLLMLANSHSKMNTTKAVIVDIERRVTGSGKNKHRQHDVYVEYTDKHGNKHESLLDSYSSSMYTGKEITVYYSDDNPNKVHTPEIEYQMGLMFTIMGAIVFIIGICIGIVILKDRNRIKKLKETGRKVECSILEVRENYKCTINGRHPLIIDCEYTDDYSGITYKLSSKNINRYAQVEVGSKIYAYIDRDNHKNYYVDTGNLIEDSRENVIDLRK